MSFSPLRLGLQLGKMNFQKNKLQIGHSGMADFMMDAYVLLRKALLDSLRREHMTEFQ